jgi:hypothetical protein
MKTRQTGHLLIATGAGTWIEPATFFLNGTAVHRAIGTSRPFGYTVTHVRSGAHLRTSLPRPIAYRLAEMLRDTDFTFDSGAVTNAHADRVREAYEAATANAA